MAFLSPHVDGIWPSCCADAGATGGPVAVGFSEKYAAIIAPWTIELDSLDPQFSNAVAIETSRNQ